MLKDPIPAAQRDRSLFLASGHNYTDEWVRAYSAHGGARPSGEHEEHEGISAIKIVYIVLWGATTLDTLGRATIVWSGECIDDFLRAWLRFADP